MATPLQQQTARRKAEGARLDARASQTTARQAWADARAAKAKISPKASPLAAFVRRLLSFVGLAKPVSREDIAERREQRHAAAIEVGTAKGESLEAANDTTAAAIAAAAVARQDAAIERSFGPADRATTPALERSFEPAPPGSSAN